jgi:Fe-S cluster biogenesis protein NfuA
MSEAVLVELEFTPNPDSLKYRVNRNLLARGARNFSSAEEAAGSKLAFKIFEIGGISNVMIGTNFVSVNFSNQEELPQKNEALQKLIQHFVESGEPVIEIDRSTEGSNQNLTDVERKIVDFLDQEVRPAVAMDGGDISFEKFEDGFVFLKMQGSCSGCPSSLMTLKMGVETRLKEVVPEVKEVIPV